MAAKKKPTRAVAREATPARASRGKAREGASFPVPPTRAGLPRDYAETLGEIKQRIQQERLRVVLTANSAMVLLYWDIGRMILDRQQREGWGARVIDRLARDLRESYPDMKGISARNLLFMRSFAEACPDGEKVKQLVSQLPWGHLIRLLQGVKGHIRHQFHLRQGETFAAKPQVHSGLGLRTARWRNCASGHCTIAMAPEHRLSRTFSRASSRPFQRRNRPATWQGSVLTKREIAEILRTSTPRWINPLGLWRGFAFVGKPDTHSCGGERARHAC